MSKRVEVREGDRWFVASGSLYQKRNGEERHVCHMGGLGVSHWNTAGTSGGENILPQVARAWIEACGGEWAEVAEEKKPEAVKLVAYADAKGLVYIVVEGSDEHKQLISTIQTFRRITIAGVTT
jgi:hypothetical protein